MQTNLVHLKSHLKERKTWYVMVVAVVAAAAAVGIYIAAQAFYFQTPNKIWHDALSNSLQNRTVTVTIAQKSDEVDRRQTVSYNAGGQNQAHSDVVLRSSDSLVVTESIGTVDADYSRYTNIQADGKDYKNVLNVWAKTERSQDTTAQTEAPLLPGVALRTASVPGVPLIDAPVAQQIALYGLLKKAVTADFKTVKTETVNGQAAKVYTATIKPEAYITYLKALDEALGYQTLTQVTTESYQGRDSVKVQLTIAADSHRLIGLTIPGAEGYQEQYGDYGKPLTVTIPAKTITSEELQTRLQSD